MRLLYRDMCRLERDPVWLIWQAAASCAAVLHHSTTSSTRLSRPKSPLVSTGQLQVVSAAHNNKGICHWASRSLDRHLHLQLSSEQIGGHCPRQGYIQSCMSKLVEENFFLATLSRLETQPREPNVPNVSEHVQLVIWSNAVILSGTPGVYHTVTFRP